MHGKLRPSWEGPYIVTRVIRPGNFELQTEEGIFFFLLLGMLSTLSILISRPLFVILNKVLSVFG